MIVDTKFDKKVTVGDILNLVLPDTAASSGRLEHIESRLHALETLVERLIPTLSVETLNTIVAEQRFKLFSPKRTIIAGSRSAESPKLLRSALRKCGWTPKLVVSGCAPGADSLGASWAEQHAIPVRSFPADWKKLGKRAGMVRNVEMAKHADSLIALWDGSSPGTDHMITVARARGLLVYVHLFDPETQA